MGNRMYEKYLTVPDISSRRHGSGRWSKPWTLDFTFEYRPRELPRHLGRYGKHHSFKGDRYSYIIPLNN